MAAAEEPVRREQKEKTVPAERSALSEAYLARRLTVVINNNKPTAYGAKPGRWSERSLRLHNSMKPPCPSLSAERWADKLRVLQ